MESPLQVRSFFPAVNAPETKRTHIPIRSITYKKSLAGMKDLDLRKDMLNTMGKFNLASPMSTMQHTSSPTRASTHHGSKPETPGYRPHMACTFHKLSMMSQKESPRKLPVLKSPRLQTEIGNSLYVYEDHQKNLKKHKTNMGNMSAQDDYFHLLYDENRKTFKVEECAGVDEFYTNDMIKTRIHKQGFRDPEYYSTRIEHTPMQVPDEKTIREDFRFKIPAVVSTMENDNTLAAHVLGGTWNNIKFIESMIERAQHEMKGIKTEKKQIEGEVAAIKKKADAEIENIEADFAKRFEKLSSIIKEDFIANQNENFKFQKEIVLLKRDKLKIERDIENCIPHLENLDNVLYGQNMFDLQVNDEGLDYISQMNLRPEMLTTMSNKGLIH